MPPASVLGSVLAHCHFCHPPTSYTLAWCVVPWTPALQMGPVLVL